MKTLLITTIIGIAAAYLFAGTINSAIDTAETINNKSGFNYETSFHK